MRRGGRDEVTGLLSVGGGIWRAFSPVLLYPQYRELTLPKFVVCLLAEDLVSHCDTP